MLLDCSTQRIATGQVEGMRREILLTLQHHAGTIGHDDATTLRGVDNFNDMPHVEGHVFQPHKTGLENVGHVARPPRDDACGRYRTNGANQRVAPALEQYARRRNADRGTSSSIVMTSIIRFLDRIFTRKRPALRFRRVVDFSRCHVSASSVSAWFLVEHNVDSLHQAR